MPETTVADRPSTSRSNKPSVSFDMVVRQTIDETRTQKKLKVEMAEKHREDETHETRITSDDDPDDVFYPMLLHAKEEMPPTTQPYVKPNQPWPMIFIPIILLLSGTIVHTQVTENC